MVAKIWSQKNISSNCLGCEKFCVTNWHCMIFDLSMPCAEKRKRVHQGHFLTKQANGGPHDWFAAYLSLLARALGVTGRGGPSRVILQISIDTQKDGEVKNVPEEKYWESLIAWCVATKRSILGRYTYENNEVLAEPFLHIQRAFKDKWWLVILQLICYI